MFGGPYVARWRDVAQACFTLYYTFTLYTVGEEDHRKSTCANATIRNIDEIDPLQSISSTLYPPRVFRTNVVLAAYFNVDEIDPWLIVYWNVLGV